MSSSLKKTFEFFKSLVGDGHELGIPRPANVGVVGAAETHYLESEDLCNTRF
jgi:hypothetical protein